MALKLDQIKRGKAPQRRNEGAPSFIKDKTLAPFEIPPVKNNDLIGAQLEHNSTDEFQSKIVTPSSSSSSEVLNASQLSDAAPLASNHPKSDSGTLNDSKNIRAQLEHSHLSNKSSIGAQLEHNKTSDSQLNIDSDSNKSTIRAQLDVSQRSNKSTIRAQKNVADDLTSANQLEHSHTSNKSTIRAHSGAQLEHKEVSNKDTNRAQLDYNKSSKQSTTATLNRAQIEHKYLRSDFEMLSGHELNFLKYIHSNCVGNGNKTTSKINNQLIAEAIGIKPITLKTVVKRVTDKGFLSRETGKRGRGGWLQFTMSEELYSKMLYSFTHKSTIGVQTTENKSTDQSTTRSTEFPSSSSSINNINTTTKSRVEECSNIVIPDILVRNGFHVGKIKQILERTEWTVDEIQTFLDHFAHDLPTKKGIQNPVAYFLSVVNNGNRYESEELLRIEQTAVADYKSRIAALKEQARDEAMIQLSKKFEVYLKSLTQEQIDSMVPPTAIVKSGSDLQIRRLKSIFIEAEGT